MASLWDYPEAYFWLELAASGEAPRKKLKDALKLRNEAASHLTSDEISFGGTGSRAKVARQSPYRVPMNAERTA